MDRPTLLAHVKNILGQIYEEDEPFWNKSSMSSLKTASEVSWKFKHLIIHTFSHTAIIGSVYPTLSDF